MMSASGLYEEGDSNSRIQLCQILFSAFSPGCSQIGVLLLLFCTSLPRVAKSACVCSTTAKEVSIGFQTRENGGKLT